MSLELELQASLQNLEPKYEQKINTKYHQIGVNGDQISMLGIEDFYGNVWSFVDGFFVKDDGYYITENLLNFGEITKHKHYPTTPVMGSTDNQFQEFYFKNVEKIGLTNIPRSTGGNANGFYTDYFWSHRKTQQNICLFGGRWTNGLRAGAFCLNLYSSVSFADSYFSARLVYLP